MKGNKILPVVGYRHITLKSNTGDNIPNCTLFVHVAITNKRGGGVSSIIIIERPPTRGHKLHCKAITKTKLYPGQLFS